MKAIISTEDLSRILCKANTIIKRGTSVQIIARKLSDMADDSTPEPGEVSVLSFDGTTISTWKAAAEVAVPGSVAIKGDALEKFLRASQKSDRTLGLETTEVDNIHSLRVITARGAHEFEGFPETVFRSIDPGKVDGDYANLKSLSDAILMAKSASASEAETVGARIFLSGIHLRHVGNHLHVVGTDGKRLAWCCLLFTPGKGIEIPEQGGVTIPGAMVPKVAKMMSEDAAKLSADETSMVIETTDGIMAFRLIASPFPEYAEILGCRNAHVIRLSKTDLEVALDRCSAAIANEDRFSAATIFRDGSGIHLTSATSQESSSEKISDACGTEISIGFNVAFMKRALEQMPTPEIFMTFTDHNTPIVIGNEDRPDLSMIVMPCRVPLPERK